MARTLVAPMLLALGLGACALENPEVRVGPGSTLDAAIDLGVTPDVGTPIDQPMPPVDLGSDAGELDTGVVDTGVIDTGMVDTGVIDTGVVDTGVIDTGPVDTGPVDTGPVDTGPVDTGVVDAGFPDVVVPRDVGGTDVPVTPTCGAENQGCCTGPMRCIDRLSCQPQFLAPSRCLPCGGYLQVCCEGSCRAGPCRIGICTGI
ncbi:MAG: hypothetical protein EPO40_34775 [Myxococcaceae bacterium]|nr:MAG: hypothetical protein EPO40_34775 [Myxococcaceae bacterium]